MFPASTGICLVNIDPRPARPLHILTSVSHRVRTLTAREDLIGWVCAGRKTLVSTHGEHHFPASTVFLIPRNTHWDVINEAQAKGGYEVRLISLSPELIGQFYKRFGQFSPLNGLAGCARTAADEPFIQTFKHALTALENPATPISIQEHRSLEILLLLAERGLCFAPMESLSWRERVCRLIGQRPNADWNTRSVAAAFHLSSSSLQRRLSEEGTALGSCIREVRLESALALLQSTQLNIAEIANRSGYASHSRFSAAFRTRFGYAPSCLRP